MRTWIKKFGLGLSKTSNWPKWDDETSFRTPNFNFSCSTRDYSGKTDLETIALLKDRKFLDFYKDLFRCNSIQSILEIGYFQGGMPLFLADMFAPEKIVGIDWYPPSEALTDIIDRHGLSSSIKLIGDIDQADTARIRAIVDEEFGLTPLDLIIDDCSHYYPQTKACFEALFGYLRPGGKYVIEDWGWTHWPGPPWQTSKSHFDGMVSMTNLVFELVMGLGSDQDKIARVEILSHACVVVTRGEDLPYKAPIDLKAITNIAGGRRAELIVMPDKSRWLASRLRRSEGGPNV